MQLAVDASEDPETISIQYVSPRFSTGLEQLNVVVAPFTLGPHATESVDPSNTSSNRLEPLTPLGVGTDSVMALPNVTPDWVDPVNVICQKPSAFALSGLRVLLCAAGGESELAALKTTLTPLGSVADAGNVTVAPVMPDDAGSVTVAPAAGKSVCVTAPAVGVGVGAAGDDDAVATGDVFTEPPPQPVIIVDITTRSPSPKNGTRRDVILQS